MLIESLKVGQEVCLRGGCGITRYSFDWFVKDIKKTKIIVQRGSAIREFNKYGEELGAGRSVYRDQIMTDVQKWRDYEQYEERRLAALRAGRELKFDLGRYSDKKHMASVVAEHEKKLAELKELIAAIPELKE